MRNGKSMFNFCADWNCVSDLRSLSYVNLHQKDAVKDQTIKVYLSIVKINERFGTAIAIWIFSI